MSFQKILEKKGKEVVLIKFTEQTSYGYVEKTEQSEVIKAVVLPLKAEEIKFWADVGISKASFKAFTDCELNTGWQMEIDGKRYTVRAYENYGEYNKAILEAVE